MQDTLLALSLVLHIILYVDDNMLVKHFNNDEPIKGIISKLSWCLSRWHRAQVISERINNLVREGKINEKQDQKYKNRLTFAELHVDNHLVLQDEANYLLFGGSLPVHHDPSKKPLIICVQYECIFKQNTLKSKSWSTPDGT
jgi:hypothetical protein